MSAILRHQSGYPFSQTTDTPLDVDGDLNFNAIDHDFERNSFEAPSLENIDFRVAKIFGVGGRFQTTLLLEFFNLLNEENPAAVESNPTSITPFGEPLQVLPGREGQLGVRFEF